MSPWRQVSNVFKTLKDLLLGDDLSFQPGGHQVSLDTASASNIKTRFAPSPKRRRTHEAKQDGQIEWLISYVLSSAKLVPLSLSQTIKAKALRRCRTLYQVDIEF